MPIKVYISSVFKEFSDIRAKIKKTLDQLPEVFDFMGMEEYGAEDRGAIGRCVEDVNNCDIYICILGYEYGTDAIPTAKYNAKLSFTHWEFNTASQRKAAGKKIERFIYLYEKPGCNDSDPRLTDLKQNILKPQRIMCRRFGDIEELPKKILEDLGLLISKKLGDHKSSNLKYACDREVPNYMFEGSLNNDPVQFFLLHGHEKDMPHYFIKRKQLDFEVKENSTLVLELQTNRIIEETKDYKVLDKLVKGALYDKLPPGSGITRASDVNMDALLHMMEKLNYKYLLISWYIQSIHWKQDFFFQHIKTFYDSCRAFTPKTATTRQIIYFGIAKYIDNSKITREEFDERVKKIEFGNALPGLTKISLNDVKEWMISNALETNPDEAMEMITEKINTTTESEYYYSELEDALITLINESDNQN